MELPPKLRLLSVLLQSMRKKSVESGWKDLASRFDRREPHPIGVLFLREGVRVRFIVNANGVFDWFIGYKGLGRDVATEVMCDTIDTIFAIRAGKQKVIIQKTGVMSEMPFDFETAVMRGKISWRGDGATQTIRRLVVLLTEDRTILERIIP